jgi:glycosyltransferase involved in cell wall biosynthesis
MKRLLIIAYYFPPAAVVGTNRITRFVKYLPTYGWETLVLTVDEKYYDLRDETINIEPNKYCEVVRTEMTEITDVHRIYEKTAEGGLKATGLQRIETKNKIRRLLQTYLSVPDTRAGWIPKAVKTALKILHENKIDAVLTTSFPYSAHIIGLILKSLKDIFWLADFRDPWAEYAFLYPNTEFHKRASYYFENKVISNANVIVANTQPARDRLKERYPQYSNKIQVIPNGYDQQEIDLVKQKIIDKQQNFFTILHAGTIQAEKERRYPNNLFEATSKFITKYPDIKNKIVLKFIGHSHFSIDLEKLANQNGLYTNVQHMGWVNHEKALYEMANANVLLLMHHSEEHIPKLFSTIPAKTYEYMAVKKPILCLTTKGAVGELISKGHFGISVDPTNINDLVNALENLYFNYNYWELQIKQNNQHHFYEAQKLTYALSQLLP